MPPEKMNYRIGFHRMRVGLSQGDLAEAVGCSTKTILRYENGQVEPSAGVLARIAAALDTSVDELLNLPVRLPSELEIDGRRYILDPTVGPPEADPASGEGSGRGEPRAATPDLGANADARASRRGRAGQRAPRPPRAPKKDG